MKAEVTKSMNALLNWMKENGPAGYDPYDIYERSDFFLNLLVDKRELSFPRLFIRYGLEKSNQFFPRLLRYMLGVRPMHHATYYGNMLQCHTNLHAISEGNENEKLISFYKSWLLENRCDTYSGSSWGTPFSWRSGSHVYERGTPFSVVTSWVGDAFFSLYELTQDGKDLDVCIEICAFFLTHLNRSNGSGDSFCFSYSPVKADQIHNANLFVAEFIMRVGVQTGNEEWVEIAKRAMDFTLNDQLESGLIPYYASTSPAYRVFNDAYHASYEMRMLHSLWKLSGEKRIHDAITQYLNYFCENFINSDGSISVRAQESYPIDITAQADVIVLFTTLQNDFDTSPHLHGLLKFAISEMQSDAGYFYYRKVGRYAKHKMPYIRWGQGWMALALSHYLRHG